MDQEPFNARFDERIDDIKRHNAALQKDKQDLDVIFEGLRQDIQLMADVLTFHIQVQHVQRREYFDRQFSELHALIRSYLPPDQNS